MGSVTKADIDRLVDGTTVAREFVDTVARCADSTALRWMQLDGTLGSVSFAEFGDRRPPPRPDSAPSACSPATGSCS